MTMRRCIVKKCNLQQRCRTILNQTGVVIPKSYAKTSASDVPIVQGADGQKPIEENMTRTWCMALLITWGIADRRHLRKRNYVHRMINLAAVGTYKRKRHHSIFYMPWWNNSNGNNRSNIGVSSITVFGVGLSHIAINEWWKFDRGSYGSITRLA